MGKKKTSEHLQLTIPDTRSPAKNRTQGEKALRVPVRGNLDDGTVVAHRSFRRTQVIYAAFRVITLTYN